MLKREMGKPAGTKRKAETGKWRRREREREKAGTATLEAIEGVM